MNNKGFAISIILYSMVFLLITVLYIILGALKARYNTTTSIRSDIMQEFNEIHILSDKVKKLGDNANIEYVRKYDVANGLPTDAPDGSGDSEVYYYDSPESILNNNVIFGDYCWQILRTTATGGVKLIYNGIKTNDDKCPSDKNNRPEGSYFAPASGTSYEEITITGEKTYGTSFEIFDDNGTKKFRLLHTDTYSWGDSTYQNIVGKFVCGTSTSSIINSDTCTIVHYVSYYVSSTKASTVAYEIRTLNSLSIGDSPFNGYDVSPGLAGYMYNDLYKVKSFSNYSFSDDYISYTLNPSAYYYGDSVIWVTDHYELKMNGATPASTTSWQNIRGNVKGMYTCKSTSSTSCASVSYIIDNSTDIVMRYITLSNNETINDKKIIWKYSKNYTKSGNNYVLSNPNTATILLKDWMDYYNNKTYDDIYVCSDFTSTTCLELYYIPYFTKLGVYYNKSSENYIYGNNITYSNGSYTIDSNNDSSKYQHIWEWYKYYDTISKSHYTCFETDTNECGDKVYFIYYTGNSSANYIELKNGDTIETALNKMFNMSNSTSSNINKYSSAVKAMIDSWYENNLDSLSEYLDDNAVFCNDRSIINISGFDKNGSTLNKESIKFKGKSLSAQTASLTCSNVTDRFSKNSTTGARLIYPVGMVSADEQLLSRYSTISGSTYWMMTPSRFYQNKTAIYTINYQNSFSESSSANNTAGVRPVIVLKPGIEVIGKGTYDEPYVVIY